jgi:chemotaxis protein CheC
MNAEDGYLLTSQQLRAFGSVLHRGAAEASAALQRWLDRPALVSVDAVEQLDLHDATEILGTDEAPLCFCAAEVTGRLSGEFILAFDDASGLALADILLHQPPGTARQWDELETSAALETTNIVGCAYLNVLVRLLPPAPGATSQLLPSPPRWRRDFAASLLQFALMSQAVTTNHVFLARSRFQIDGTPINWTLLFVPDAASVRELGRLLPTDAIPADAPPLEAG